MTCRDAREKLSILRAGMDLTERALVHAHVMQCEECGKAREESLQQVASVPVVSGQTAMAMAGVARAGFVRAGGHLARVGWLLPTVVAPSVRTATSLTGCIPIALTRLVHLLTWLHSAFTMAFQGTARVTTVVARAGGTRVLDLPPRLGVLLSIASTVSEQAAVRVIEAAHTEVMRAISVLTRARWLLLTRSASSVRVAGNVIGHIRLVIARLAHLLIGVRVPLMIAVRRAARAMIGPARAGVMRTFDVLPRVIAVIRSRSFMKVGAGIVSLAVLVSALLLWTGGRVSPDARPPADRKTGLAAPSTPMPISAAQPSPVEAAPQEPRPVTLRPRSSGTQAEIPAPLGGSEQALTQRRATTSAPPPAPEAIQNADAPDPTAAIDWLLQGGRGRRQIENP